MSGLEDRSLDASAISVPPLNQSATSDRLRCIIIGAGVSGILMAYKLKAHLSQDVDFTIFEKNPELGGTWYENRYPGCACDVPSHVYQYPFAPNPDWSRFYASSAEIQNYLKSICRTYDLDKYIRYNTEVNSARWDESRGVWVVEYTGDTAGSLEAEVLVNAGGILNNYKWPAIPGFQDFQGVTLHTASWDSDVDLRDKRVAIIGSGASAIQLLPAIQPVCKSVDIYIRTPSWISPPCGAAPDELDGSNKTYEAQERTRFRSEAGYSIAKRKHFENDLNGNFAAFFRKNSEQQTMRAQFEKYMCNFITDPELQKKLIPGFEAGCRRINPSQPYLSALQQPNVRPIFDPITRVHPDGLEVAVSSEGLEDTNQTFTADIIVAATGFDTSFKPRFPIVGRGGADLRDVWSTTPVSYMGTGVAGFPNYLTFLGPNTPISNGSLMGPIEATGDFFIRLLTKMRREGVKSVEPSYEAQMDFFEHTQDFMKDMVWTGSCSSWFKREMNGPITALWPGSTLHYMQTLAEDRWHDYEWKFRRNRFGHWGQGFSWIQRPGCDPLGVQLVEAKVNTRTVPQKDSDLSFYLHDCEPFSVSMEDDTTKHQAPLVHVIQAVDQLNVDGVVSVQGGEFSSNITAQNQS